MMRERKLNQRRATVTGALHLLGETGAREITEYTGLYAQNLYPALRRLEDEGVTSSRWEDGPYPRRRLYRLGGITEADPTEMGHHGVPREGDTLRIHRLDGTHADFVIAEVRKAGHHEYEYVPTYYAQEPTQ